MPIYEYHCQDCRRRVSVFFRTFSAASDEAARCPRCNGANLHRLVSRVAVLKSEESRMDNMADSSFMSGSGERGSARPGIFHAQDERRNGRAVGCLN